MRRVVLPVFAVLSALSLGAAPQGPPPQSPATPSNGAPARAIASRHPEEGRPLIRGYRPNDVGMTNQVWDMVQDNRGVFFVGNNIGIAEYDGSSWRRIRVGPFTSTRSLVRDASGRIYVGATRQIGFLAPNAAGDLAFVSLNDKIPAGDRNFTEVFRIFALADGVYFQTEQGIYKWANDRFTVIKPKSRFNRAALVEGRIYVPVPETGLNVLEGATLRPLPGTESLGSEIFPLVFRYDARRLLIGTRLSGMFLYDGAHLTPFPTQADPVFQDGQLYRGIVLADGNFALTTTGAGMVILDRNGRLVMHVNRDVGLPSDVVYNVFADREGALWLTLDNGIARVDTPSPVSFLDQRENLAGTPFDMIRFDGALYIASQTGVQRLTPGDATSRPHFTDVTNSKQQCWNFATQTDRDGAHLLVACSDGFFELKGYVALPIKATTDGTFRAATLRVSRIDPSRVWVGMFDGLTSFRRVDGRWIDEGRLPDLLDQVRSLAENPDGSIWAGTADTGFLRISPQSPIVSGEARPPSRVERFGEAEGAATSTQVCEANGGPVFVGASEALFALTFDERTKRFSRDAGLAGIESDADLSGFVCAPAPNGEVYLDYGLGTIRAKRSTGGWVLDRTTFARFGRGTATVYTEPSGVTWLARGADSRLVRFDLPAATAHTQSLTPSSALVRRVTVNHDRPLFGGEVGPTTPRLDAASNTLRFEFSLPTYIDESTTVYQSRLDGLETGWSEWTHEAQRDYTNLGAGRYVFRARARDVAGTITNEGTYAFTILPPWYRTWAAYAGYVLLALLAVVVGDRVMRRRVVARERQRAQFTEAKLRADAAEALAAAEGERKKNVELLSEMGREITASLDFETIFGKLYERVNELADADVFGVGLYHPDRHEIEYRMAIEHGKRYAPYTRDTEDKNQLPVWCIEHREPVFINDLPNEYSRYISSYTPTSQPLEDGSMSAEPQSLIYLPLVAKDRVLGIITIQSFEKFAYTEHHLNVLGSLASYTAIALDNADAYKQLNEHEHEIRRLFEEAEKARAIAEEADAAKSSFLSTVSHELRTPLTSVLGFAKIIKKRLEDRIFPLVVTEDPKVRQTIQQVEDNLKVVVSEGERLTKLIDDVLDLAKIEAGKLEWHMEGVTVADIIDRATAATSSLFDHKGLKLVKQVAPDLPPITGDRDRLIQVVINLISNAVKFTDSGTITCRAERRGSELVVSIIDTGVGISPSDQPKVFERFKQVGDTLTDKPKGTGLGLPICKEIVEHHGGRIWVDSVIGKGSIFSFSLPLTAEQAAAAGGSAPVELAALIRQLREQVIVTTPRTAERQPRILVVDDDPNIRELLSQEFTEAGYVISLATNGREAIAVVRRDRPDLVVLDVMMPEMNGFDVAAVLKNDPQTMDIPIVILSIVQDRDRGFRLGVDRYLTKPIDTDLLFREVGMLIEQKKSHKRVMVVDEDSSTVRTLTDVLTARGYSVTEARGDDFIERAVALQPDIIMLNSVSSAQSNAVQMLRFEKGMENVLFLVYQ